MEETWKKFGQRVNIFHTTLHDKTPKGYFKATVLIMRGMATVPPLMQVTSEGDKTVYMTLRCLEDCLLRTGGLRHSDNVRLNVVLLKSPEMRTKSSVTNLSMDTIGKGDKSNSRLRNE